MAIAEVGGGTQRSTIREANVDAAPGEAFPANVASGSLLIVVGAVWQSGTGITAVTVTDTLGTSYTVILAGTGVTHSGGNARPFVAYGIAPSAGANTVTVDPSGTGNYINACIDEFSGVHATPLDINGGESTGTSTTPSDGLITLTDGALVIGVMAKIGSSTHTVGSGYTLIDSDTTLVRQAYAAEFQIVGAAGAYTPDFTIGATDDWTMISVAFKPAGAGGAALLVEDGLTFRRRTTTRRITP
jgi:hypothetical protein